MIYLVDTNVLLRYADRSDPLHQTARKAVRELWQANHQPMATGQNFIEFWNVATRPESRNGFGLIPAEADRLLRLVEEVFSRLPEKENAYTAWRRLVAQFEVSGVQVHDARLVGSMLAHDITHVLTFNGTDFSRYSSEGIVAVDPASLG